MLFNVIYKYVWLFAENDLGAAHRLRAVLADGGQKVVSAGSRFIRRSAAGQHGNGAKGHEHPLDPLVHARYISQAELIEKFIFFEWRLMTRIRRRNARFAPGVPEFGSDCGSDCGSG